MKRAGTLIAALLLASCAFSSERPLFEGAAFVTPLPEGVYSWRPHPEDETLRVSFRREGDGYVMAPVDRPDERPIRARMVSIIETHDDDYIAEVDLADGDGVAYAFLWPLGDDRYRVVIDPRAFDEGGADVSLDLCKPETFGGCTFTSVADVRAYYLRQLYPALSGGQTPRRYLDIAPVDGDVPLPPVPTLPRKPTPR